jgi:plasmid stabilization system protein ParE
MTENAGAADRVIEDIRKALDNVVPFPHQGHRRTDLTSRPLRFKRVQDYLIAYAPDVNTLICPPHHIDPSPASLVQQSGVH